MLASEVYSVDTVPHLQPDGCDCGRWDTMADESRGEQDTHLNSLSSPSVNGLPDAV
jgi:hypothetical protein